MPLDHGGDEAPAVGGGGGAEERRKTKTTFLRPPTTFHQPHRLKMPHAARRSVRELFERTRLAQKRDDCGSVEQLSTCGKQRNNLLKIYALCVVPVEICQILNCEFHERHGLSLGFASNFIHSLSLCSQLQCHTEKEAFYLENNNFNRVLTSAGWFFVKVSIFHHVLLKFSSLYTRTSSHKELEVFPIPSFQHHVRAKAQKVIMCTRSAV